ncbi:MAG TPA: AAA family ATPase [Candidatus Limnocylindria bacterium]
MPTCAACGQENPATSRFCGACGAALAPASDVRKTVTIVFCDMVGSTALGERTDPEVLRELMRRYHAALRACLERHGGSVEKFVGDAAMAVFGIPRVHEDDPLRAVRAALEMREAVRPLGLDVRVGVNTGEVVTGRGETLVTGDAVNVAARLEQAAHAGEILIGGTTAALVGSAARVEAVEPLALKGKAEPVAAFRVLSLVTGADAFPRSMETPFVGRDGELALLDRAFTTAVEGRIAQLATVVGPPGIGKSRLLHELLARAQARLLEGRCLSYGDGITYWPLAEIAARIGDVRTALGNDGDAALAAQRIDAALGVPGAAASAEEIAWGFRKLFEALARERPLIVVLDDIHWAEPALLDLIEYVAAFAQGVPLMLLCSARPELFERRPTWATPRPNVLVLTLEPLATRDSARLVDALGALSDEQRARIVDAAEGNPLFVEQLVAMQRESAGRTLTIPPSLQALLAARIDSLGLEERSVLERGSVEGRVFHRGAVAQLLPAPERPRVGTQLLTLVRKELIRPDQATLPGDDAFRFGHVLIRDAAYEAMPKRERADLHEQFADWLAARLGDAAPVEIVGYHLEQAYRYRAELGAPDPALGIRAAEHLAAAARAATLRGDVAATAKLERRALELVPDEHPLKRQLLVRTGRTLHNAGELDASEDAIRRAETLAREAGDTHTLWSARIELALIGLFRAPQGAIEAALETSRAAREAVPPEDHDVRARAWRLAAATSNLRGQLGERRGSLDAAVAEARAAGDRALEAILTTELAPVFLFGEATVADGLRFVEEASERLGDVPSVRAFCLHVHGHLRARLGEVREGKAEIAAYREHARELGNEAMYAGTAGCIYDVCALGEDWAGAEQALREAWPILERMGEKAELSTIVGRLGMMCFRQGRVDEAERYARLSAELGSSEDALNEAVWRDVLAHVLASRGERAEAETLARAAILHADRTDTPELRADVRLSLAEVLGTGPAALAAVREARVLYERKGNLVSAARAATFEARLAG